MRVLIIEDEKPAARHLSGLLQGIRPQAKVLDLVDSVEGAVKWLRTFAAPDLIFMDIQLADGLSFEIFQEVPVEAPVVFTTAYDQYTLKAFKVNSVDYLLKPIDPDELRQSIEKYEKWRNPIDPAAMSALLKGLHQPRYKERFLIRAGQQLSYLPVADIAYLYSEEGLLYARSRSGKRHLIDFTLEQVAELLSPEQFFRINRKIMVHLESIHKIHTYFNGRLKLELRPDFEDLEVIVSRDRVGDFKLWLDR